MRLKKFLNLDILIIIKPGQFSYFFLIFGTPSALVSYKLLSYKKKKKKKSVLLNEWVKLTKNIECEISNWGLSLSKKYATHVLNKELRLSMIVS